MSHKHQIKSDGDSMSPVELPDESDRDDSEFVENDPTGRYGRVGSLTSWLFLFESYYS